MDLLVFEALNGLLSKFKQIFLITHVDDIEDDAKNIIYITENEDGITWHKSNMCNKN